MEKDEAIEILKSRRWKFTHITDPDDPRPAVVGYDVGLESTDGRSKLLEALRTAGLPGIRSSTAYVSRNEKEEGYKGYVEPIRGSVAPGLGVFAEMSGYMIGGRENLDYMKSLGIDIPGYTPRIPGR